MITIQVDEKACVSCEMCVDACPTGVYQFDSSKGVPAVARPKECFGCLACAQVCPAAALEHQGVIRSRHFYHDPYALDMVVRLVGAHEAPELPDQAAIEKALDDLGIRLLSLAPVLQSTLSSGLPGVGLFAGRMLARQLPRYQVPKNADEALDLAKKALAPAWEVETRKDGELLSVTVNSCLVREICSRNGLELGGGLCTLFFNYLAGYLNGMCKLRLRLLSASRGWERCNYETRIYS